MNKVVPKETKASVAAAQAIQVGANPRDLELARKYLGTSKFIGYCQAFVRQVTGGLTSGASAIQAWNKAPQKVFGIQGLQPGDLVYFDQAKSNRGYGHTGIYAGNGQFISATDKGIRQAGLMEWIKRTGQNLLGYVPNSERAIPPTPQPQTSPQQAPVSMAQQSPMFKPTLRQPTQVPTPFSAPQGGINLNPKELQQGNNLGQFA